MNKRKTISEWTKKEIIKEWLAGRKQVDLALLFDLSPSAVNRIIRNPLIKTKEKRTYTHRSDKQDNRWEILFGYFFMGASRTLYVLILFLIMFVLIKSLIN